EVIGRDEPHGEFARLHHGAPAHTGDEQRHGRQCRKTRQSGWHILPSVEVDQVGPCPRPYGSVRNAMFRPRTRPRPRYGATDGLARSATPAYGVATSMLTREHSVVRRLAARILPRLASTISGGADARERNDQTRAGGQARWKGAVHTGRRVRAGGDASRTRGQARRALEQAGDRDRAVQGAALRRQAGPTQEGSGLEAYAAASVTRRRQGQSGNEARPVAPAIDSR